MISVERLCDNTGKQFYSVESRLPDGKLQCITRSFKLKCNHRGFDDAETRSKALRFAITTDTLTEFRAFIFSEQDTPSAPGRTEGSLASPSPRADGYLPLGSPPDSLKRRIRSYVCMRQNRLTGLRFVVAMSRLDNGRLRAVSFQDHSVVGVGIPDEALTKAVRFLRGVAFESWRKQAMNELVSRDREPVDLPRERALKHVSAFVGIEDGEKVDCACGKNRSRGVMVACDRCGAWEHAECQGFLSEEQIDADYICSACMRADREDVVVIRLDEQGECANLQLEDLWTDTKIRDADGDEHVCCVCGCEDNQDYETMIQPVAEHVCDGGAASAHPSCVSAAQHQSHKAWTRQAVQAGMCQICGDRLPFSPKGNEEILSLAVSGVSKSTKSATSPNASSQIRNPRRAAKVDQSSRKRLRSALVNGGVAPKVEVAEKRPTKSAKEEEVDVHAGQSGEKADVTVLDANKVGATSVGRRFSDAAVTVPIKKRRIQMLEVARSPSPPPRSPTPPAQIDMFITQRDPLQHAGLNFKVEASEDAEMLEGGPLEDDSVTVAGVHDVSIGHNKDGCRQSMVITDAVHSERGAGGNITGGLQGSELVTVGHEAGVAERVVGSGQKGSDVSLQRRSTKSDNRASGNVIDVGRNSDLDMHGSSRVRQEEDQVHDKGKFKFAEKLKLAENGMPQHDKATMAQKCRLKEITHHDATLGLADRAGNVMESKDEFPRHSGVVETKVFTEELDIKRSHESMSEDCHSKKVISMTAAEILNLQDRHILNEAVGSDDLGSSGPEQAVNVRDGVCDVSGKNCHDSLGGRDVHQEAPNSLGDVESKDVAKSSSASQGPSRDVRLHWDLNMDMEEWERPPEEDTGTFTGVSPGLASKDNKVDDVNKVGLEDKRSNVLPVQVDSGHGSGVLLEVPSNELDSTKEASSAECIRDASSTDGGGMRNRPALEAEEMDSASKESSGKILSDSHPIHMQEAVAATAAELVMADCSDDQLLPTSHENFPCGKQESLPEGVNPKLILQVDCQDAGDRSGEVVVVKAKNSVEVDEDHVAAAPDVEMNSTVITDRSSDKVPLCEGQASASMGFVELGAKPGNNADFSCTSEVTIVKMDSVETTAVVETSTAEIANAEIQVVSADNYDFVEYDASDEEDERISDAEKLDPEKVEEKLQSTDFGRPGSPHEWNEDHVEEMEAEHVDYDDSGDSRDGEGPTSEAEDKADSKWRDPAGTHPVEQLGGEGHKALKLSPGQADEGGVAVDSVVGPRENSQVEVAHEVRLNAEVADCQSFELKHMDAQDQNIEPRDSEGVCLVERQDEGAVPHREALDAKCSEKTEGVVKKEEKRIHESRDTSAVRPGVAKRGDGQGRTKSSGWDQLPEGFDNPDDALRAAKGNPVIRTGRGAPWGSTNGRGASISPRGGPVASRFGRGLRNENAGDRPRSEDSWTRDDHPHGLRGDDNVEISPRLASPRDLGRGRSHGRGSSPIVRARGRMEPWIDSPSGPSSPWGPNRHPSPPGRYGDNVGFGPRGPTNAAAVAAAKVESSGFVVAPDGTVTKAGSSGRGPLRPFQSGGRNGRGVMFNMGRGGPGMGMGVGMNLGGLRVTMGMGRGMGMGPGMGMNIGLGMGMGMGVGPGLGLGLAGRGGPGGRGMVDRYSGPYSARGTAGSPLVEDSSSSRRGRSHEEYSENWSRREERSASPRRKRSASRKSRSRTHSRSRSRTRSPRLRTPANSSGSGGVLLDKSSKKRSNSPVAPKLEPKLTERAESPPARRSVPPPPKLPLPPPPPRSQRSPPAGLKRLSDSKRDGDRARSRDRERERERERPTARTRTPPRRTSPHVVHGSALMDDRDRQLLAGIRHVSPASGRHRSTEIIGTVAVGSSRDSPPIASPLGRIGETNSESRRQSGDEGGDSRGHGPRREETGPKLEQRSSKESSRGDRDRSSRRDGGRDEDRRDVGKLSYSRDRDGRGSSSLKYNREGDDDVAPRRRRPSP